MSVGFCHLYKDIIFEYLSNYIIIVFICVLKKPRAELTGTLRSGL